MQPLDAYHSVPIRLLHASQLTKIKKIIRNIQKHGIGVPDLHASYYIPFTILAPARPIIAEGRACTLVDISPRLRF